MVDDDEKTPEIPGDPKSGKAEDINLSSQDDVDAIWKEALEEQASAKEHAEKAKFDPLTADKKNETTHSLDVILDIPVSLSMEVGKTTISIRNLLQLNQGSVVELDRLAGEPLDVMVNGTLIAHGEVVVVNDKFGIRLTSVMSAEERIKKLSAEPHF